MADRMRLYSCKSSSKGFEDGGKLRSNTSAPFLFCLDFILSIQWIRHCLKDSKASSTLRTDIK